MKKRAFSRPGYVIVMAVFALLVASSACQSQGGSYGVPIAAGTWQKVTIQAILAHPDEYAGKTVIVSGKTGQVCLSSGCWLFLVDGEDELFVQFYDFTVQPKPQTPLRLQGKVKIKNRRPFFVAEGLEVLR